MRLVCLAMLAFACGSAQPAPAPQQPPAPRSPPPAADRTCHADTDCTLDTSDEMCCPLFGGVDSINQHDLQVRTQWCSKNPGGPCPPRAVVSARPPTLHAACVDGKCTASP